MNKLLLPLYKDNMKTIYWMAVLKFIIENLELMITSLLEKYFLEKIAIDLSIRVTRIDLIYELL